jgi:transcriptional regulator with XRE-family HTH domain
LLDVLGPHQYDVFINRKEQREMLGENIKKYRQEKHFTQEELAARLHVTRQTVSKWEKNYSVPDAEMLVRLAELLEVQTSLLLGIEADGETQITPEKENALAEQLASIAEQMAIKNRRSKRIWKTIGIVIAIIIAANIIITVLSMVSYSSNTSTGNIQIYEQTEQTMELEE